MAEKPVVVLDTNVFVSGLISSNGAPGAVLRRFRQGVTVLDKIKEHLTPGGCVIASLPNVRHFRTLFELIFKKDWQYRDQGVLDHTHLRFFTQKSARRKFENARFKVELSRGIQPSKKWYLYIFNFLTLGFFRDSLFFQFAWRVRV